MTSIPQVRSRSSTTSGTASPSDVALLLKTGSSNVWRRLPLHLLTTFANARIPNYAIYSDAEERLAPGIGTIDTIANVSQLLRKHDANAYGIYQSQQDAIRPYIYREQSGLTGDTLPPESEGGNPKGWVLDRYKFLPMLAHAYGTWPLAKWYVYMEDDTYLFWHNILQWLTLESSSEAGYYGASSGPSNATFAQGDLESSFQML